MGLISTPQIGISERISAAAGQGVLSQGVVTADILLYSNSEPITIKHGEVRILTPGTFVASMRPESNDAEHVCIHNDGFQFNQAQSVGACQFAVELHASGNWSSGAKLEVIEEAQDGTTYVISAQSGHAGMGLSFQLITPSYPIKRFLADGSYIDGSSSIFKICLTSDTYATIAPGDLKLYMDLKRTG